MSSGEEFQRRPARQSKAMRTETEAPARGRKRRRQTDLAAKAALRSLLPARRLVLGIAVALLAGLAGVATGAAGATAAAVWPPGVTIDPHTDAQGPVALIDVSCPTKRFCAALDAAGYVLASANPAGGAAAWRQVESGANFMPGSILGQISCASSHLCVVVDGSRHVYTSRDPLGGPRTWRRIRLGSRLGDVSCPSDRFCAAIGNGAVLTSTDPTGGARAWTHTPADINSPFVEPHTVGLYAVSCASSHLCVAVDTLGERSSRPTPRQPPGTDRQPGSNSSSGPATSAPPDSFLIGGPTPAPRASGSSPPRSRR